jgi:fatty-acyl-CoA synthase
MSTWNFASVWEVVAEVHPDAPALSQGDRRFTWAEFDRRADALATVLLGAGLGHQAKVAQYLYSAPEYLDSVYACFKAGLVPINTNYRYTEDELVYLWDNADVEAVIFHGSLGDRVASVRDQLPGVRAWLHVDDGSPAAPAWAMSYEQAAAGPVEARGVRGSWGRSGDDLLLVYTGGTTGAPKGVMWRQDDLFGGLNRTGELRYPEDATLEQVRATLLTPPRHPAPRLVPGPPLMHGTGLFTALSVLNSAGSVVMLESRRLDVEQLLDTIESERATELSIVGDAFAKPLLAALDAQPGRWDLSSLWLVVSSGVMWSAEVKAGLLRHNPRLLLVDTLGSSEALGLAQSRSGRGGTARTAGFKIGPETRVIDDEGRDVLPGSGQSGVVARRGRGPIGYYKDPEKTAATFRLIDGERWAIPGDFATVGADGSLRLLGRGSGCINTGGEKVFPEEVEEVLKLHPAVGDAVVVGVPDERFGEIVVAIVEPEGSGGEPGALPEQDLIDWVKTKLASYKAPKWLLPVETIGRASNGKADYRRLRTYAIEAATGVSR